jgi:hypothetical protein
VLVSGVFFDLRERWQTLQVVDELGRFVLDSRQFPHEEVLSGTAITEDAVIHGTQGLRLFRRAFPDSAVPIDGSFIGLFDIEKYWQVSTDLTGQELFYFYQKGKDWGVSNSLFLLAERVKLLGFGLTPNWSAMSVPTLEGRHSQPIGARTAFKEIILVSSASRVLVSKETGHARIEKQSLSDRLSLVFSNDPHEGFSAFWTDTVNTMAGLLAQGGPVVADLSGGYDSRTVVGLLHRLRDIAPDVTLNSNVNHVADFKVANSIAEFLRIPVSPIAGTKRKLEASVQFRLWLESTLGGYLPLSRKNSTDLSAALHFTGELGASPKYGQPDMKRFFLSSVLSQKSAKNIPAYAIDVARNIAASGRIGGRYHKTLFYSVWRSRFHCGRFWYRKIDRLFPVRPLISSAFLNLYRLAALGSFSSSSVIPSLLTGANPDLLGWRNSEPAKAWRQEQLDQRFIVERVALDPVPKRCFGTMATISHPSESVNLSTEDFFDVVVAEYREARDLVEMESRIPKSVTQEGDAAIQRALHERALPPFPASKAISHIIHIGHQLRLMT